MTTKTGGVDLTEERRADYADFNQMSHETNRQYTFRNHIVASVCPQLHGLFSVKLAVLLTLIGGVKREFANGHRIRGQSHLLLIGDPGTGKSQFLRYAAKLSPRSVMTTGVGTTSAGLTCTAVKDSGEWMLEAGALVLADRGLCCIDEFSTIREADRATIHEAMEQQTLSVAKAGLVCKLNTRTTIIAATNPKGKYDENEDVSVNTNIASPLLSRFDLAFVLLDRPDETKDRLLSSFVLNSHLVAGAEPLGMREPLDALELDAANGALSADAADNNNSRNNNNNSRNNNTNTNSNNNNNNNTSARASPKKQSPVGARVEGDDVAGSTVGGLKTLSVRDWKRRMLLNGEAYGGQYDGDPTASQAHKSREPPEWQVPNNAAFGNFNNIRPDEDTISQNSMLTAKRSKLIEEAGKMLAQTWTIDKMQAFIAYVKETFTSVELSRGAKTIISEYYRYQRECDSRNQARTTVRLLESLIRIAQAHARLMQRGVAEPEDAVIAVQLVDSSMASGAILGGSVGVDSDFPEDADEEMERLCLKVVKKLKVADDELTGSSYQGAEDFFVGRTKWRSSMQAWPPWYRTTWPDAQPVMQELHSQERVRQQQHQQPQQHQPYHQRQQQRQRQQQHPHYSQDNGHRHAREEDEVDEFGGGGSMMSSGSVGNSGRARKRRRKKRWAQEEEEEEEEY